MKWKNVVGYEGFYQVSNLGQVRRIGPAKGATVGKILVPIEQFVERKTREPYTMLTVRLSRGGQVKSYVIACLVAEAFIGPKPDGMQVNHKDTDPSNNVSWNLEYVTNQGNALHASRNGLLVCGEAHASAKVTEDQVREIRKKATNGVALRQLAREYGLNVSTIHPMVHGKTWKCVT